VGNNTGVCAQLATEDPRLREHGYGRSGCWWPVMHAPPPIRRRLTGEVRRFRHRYVPQKQKPSQRRPGRHGQETGASSKATAPSRTPKSTHPSVSPEPQDNATNKTQRARGRGEKSRARGAATRSRRKEAQLAWSQEAEVRF
jgi:hypothetical protein